MTTLYEFHCLRHGATAQAPPEGGRLDWDKPCGCTDESWAAVQVTKIVDGVREEPRTIGGICGFGGVVAS